MIYNMTTVVNDKPSVSMLHVINAVIYILCVLFIASCIGLGVSLCLGI